VLEPTGYADVLENLLHFEGGIDRRFTVIVRLAAGPYDGLDEIDMSASYDSVRLLAVILAVTEANSLLRVVYLSTSRSDHST
jgi:hypothetical protein